MSATKSQEDHITRERRERAKDRQERKISRGRRRRGKQEIRVRDRVCICGSASERVSYCACGNNKKGRIERQPHPPYRTHVDDPSKSQASALGRGRSL